MIYLRKNIRFLRMALKMTLRQMDGCLGNKSRITEHWESGHSEPNFVQLSELSRTFCVSIHWLVFRDLSEISPKVTLKNYKKYSDRKNVGL